MAENDYSGDALAAAIAHLSRYVDGQEIAADCERRIEVAYAPELKRWDEGEPADDRLIAMVRNALDARSNACRFDKDVAAVRLVLAEIARLTAKDLAA